jgi:GNAT superfamily N-acetyltransferase
MSTSPIALRPAHEHDLEQLTAWSYAFERDDGHPPAVDPGVPFIADTWRAFCDDPRRGDVLIVTRGDVPVGYVIVTYFWSNEFRGSCAILDELYVDPGHRGAMGRPILDLVDAHLRSRGVRVVSLEVLDANARAATLYLRHGFVSERRSYWRRLT